MAQSGAGLEVSGLRVAFDGPTGEVEALRGVDLAVAPGTALGVVGESGCGKSVAMLATMGLLGPRARVSGRVRLDDMDLLGMPEPELERVRGGRIAMIFQDPMSSLNPVHRIATQLREALSLHRGLTGGAADAEAVRLLERVGIASARTRLGDYPHQLSGGMSQRVMIAMALAGDPDVLIADEPTTALDVTIQAQILDLLRGLQAERRMALILITHDLGVVAETADEVAVMYCGRVVEKASAKRLFSAPQHPYTRGLLASLPRMGGRDQPLVPIPGAVPGADEMPPGCAFAPRCCRAEAGCRVVAPLLVEGHMRHAVACHLVARIAA